MHIKKIYESSNTDYYSVIYNNLLEINNFKELIIDYISYTEKYNPPGFFIVDIDIKHGFFTCNN